MPEVLDLIEYEFPGDNYLHPRPIQSDACVEFRSVPECPFQGPRIAWVITAASDSAGKNWEGVTLLEFSFGHMQRFPSPA